MNVYLEDLEIKLNNVLGTEYFGLCLKTSKVRHLIENVLLKKQPNLHFYTDGDGMMGVDTMKTTLQINTKAAPLVGMNWRIAGLAHELYHLQHPPKPFYTLDEEIEEEKGAYTVSFQVLNQLSPSKGNCMESRFERAHRKNYRKYGKQYAHDWAEYVTLKRYVLAEELV